MERKHRQIVDSGLTLLAQANMPLIFWWEPFDTAVYNINRLSSSPLLNKTTFEMLQNRKLDYEDSHSFVCVVFPCLTPYNSQNLQFHSQKCLFVGYSKSKKGYKCLSQNGRLYLSRHVIFNHYDFPYLNPFSDKSYQNSILLFNFKMLINV